MERIFLYTPLCVVACATLDAMGARFFNLFSRVALILCVGVFFVAALQVFAETVPSNEVKVYVRPSVVCLVSFTDSNGDKKANINESVQWSASVEPTGPSYVYSWSGTDGLSGTASVVSKSYTTAGQADKLTKNRNKNHVLSRTMT